MLRVIIVLESRFSEELRKRLKKYFRLPIGLIDLEKEVFMKKFILNFLTDEDGQTSTEYILLVAVVAMIVFKFKKNLDKGLTGVMDKVFGEKIQDLLNDPN